MKSEKFGVMAMGMYIHVYELAAVYICKFLIATTSRLPVAY